MPISQSQPDKTPNVRPKMRARIMRLPMAFCSGPCKTPTHQQQQQNEKERKKWMKSKGEERGRGMKEGEGTDREAARGAHETEDGEPAPGEAQ